MTRNTSNKSNPARKDGNPLLAGMLIGMVIGVAMAAGLAWFIMKSPSPFVQVEPVEAKTPVAATKSATPSGSDSHTTAGVNDDKPRFEFYKVLTDKDPAVTAPPKAAVAPSQTEVKTAVPAEPLFLQAGSFTNPEDADRIKAKLALLGIEANTQTATIPDKGVWYRVRLGPYKSADELNRARIFLKQNGVDSTPMHAQ